MEFEVALAIFSKLIDERLAEMPEPVAGRRGLRGFSVKGDPGKDFVFSEHEAEFRAIARDVAFKFTDLSTEEIESLRGKSGRDGRDARFIFEEHRPEIESILASELLARADQLKLKFQDLTESDKAELKGVRGERGPKGNDFNFESHREDITHLIAESTLALVPDLKLKFSDLTEDDRAEIKGPRGPRGENGSNFEYSEHKSEIEAAIAEAHLAIVPDLKMKFSELTEEEVIQLRGARGQRGRAGKDFVFDEHREYFDSLRPKFADFSEAEKDSLKFKFENLTEDEKDSLKLKFENLTDEERMSLRGARGQRGRQGASIKGDRGEAGIRGLPGPMGLSVTGPEGRPGVDGIDGAPGRDAPTIIDIEIVERRGDWAIQITMSDGSRLLTNWISQPKQSISYIGGGGGYSVDPSTTNSGSGVVGKDGADGKSAYQIWLDNSHVGSESDFLASLIGTSGANGLDAYQVWLAAGNLGTVSDYFNSLRGAPGTPGLKGDVGDTGAEGKSAYQTWLDAGNSGTEQDFLNSLKAMPGTSDPSDNNVLLNIPCSIDVYVNAVVRMSIDDFVEGPISNWDELSNVLQLRTGTYNSVAVNALADQYKNCNVIGIVEKKVSPQICNIRIAGITSDIFYGLDVTEEYFLSDIYPGKIVITAQAPQDPGAVLLRIGQPISYSELLFQRGDRLVRGISS